MKKLVDKINREIFYYGKVDELKIYLKKLSESLGIPLDEEINKLEEISSIRKNISTLFERIYYNKSRLYYRINSSDKKVQEEWFEFIKSRSEKIDEKFINENQNYSIEIKII